MQVYFVSFSPHAFHTCAVFACSWDAPCCRCVSTHCHELQLTTAHCSTLQHTWTRSKTMCRIYMWFTNCNWLQHTAAVTNCNWLQHTAAHCRIYMWLRRTTLSICINTLQHTATHCNTLQHTATHCSTLQHNVSHQPAYSWVAPPCPYTRALARLSQMQQISHERDTNATDQSRTRYKCNKSVTNAIQERRIGRTRALARLSHMQHFSLTQDERVTNGMNTCTCAAVTNAIHQSHEQDWRVTNGMDGSRMQEGEVGGWGRDPQKCTGRDWGMGSSTI